MKVVILIAAYNEELQIGRLLEQLEKVRSDYIGKEKLLSRESIEDKIDIIVIDDGSTDATVDVVQRYSGVRCISYRYNRGKGLRLSKAFTYLRDKDYDVIITMDADGQHSPEDLRQFIRAFREGKGDLLIGNRMHQASKMPFLRRMTNYIMSKIISYKIGRYIPDSQCGYRLICSQILREISISAGHFEIETELILKAARRGFKIASLPIAVIYNSAKSYINPIIDGYRFIKLLSSSED